VGELRPESPVRRPDTARSRSEAVAELVAVHPPTADETAQIRRHLAELAVHSGAKSIDEPDLGVLRLRTPEDGVALNFAALPRWTTDGWPRSLSAVTERMRADGQWPSMLLTERDGPIGLDEALAGQGWSNINHETVLWVGAASLVPHLDPSLRIEAVQPDAVEPHQELEASIFGLGGRRRARRNKVFAAQLATGRLRAYVVRIGGEPVAVARLSMGEGDACLYAIGVAEDSRRKGIGTLITIVATRAGLALGKRIVWLSVEDGNDGARSMYEQLGFAPLFGWGRWISPQR
jgi:ribosomal protein S18 acetylase RimI-like enzyme